MLEAAEAVAFLASEDLERSETFFRDVLGLAVVSRSSFATVFRCGATTLRVTKVDALTPQPFTVLGWVVADIRSELSQLHDRGVDLIRFEGIQQDDQRVWTTPSGDLVAWFRDPDGNVLSLTELAGD